MTVQPAPPDHERCGFLWKNGNQCREWREPGADHGFCKYHGDRVERAARQPELWPEWIAEEVLPPEAKLDTAAAVNHTLTRLLRVALQGHISVRSAGSLGYVVQHILTTLPGMQREEAARSQPQHVLLGRDPQAAVLQLAESLHHALKPAMPGAMAAADSQAPAQAAPENEEAPQEVGADETTP